MPAEGPFSPLAMERMYMKHGSTEVSICLLRAGGPSCELHRLATAAGIPGQVADRGADVCCSVVRSRLIKRQPLPLIAASSAYVACRENKTPVTIKELAREIRSGPRELGRCYRSIRDGLQLSVPAHNGTTYTWKVATKVKASEEATKLSMEIVKEAVAQGFGDRNPMTLAAAAVYAACLANGDAATQTDVADAAGVSVIALRGCARQIRPLLDTLAQRQSGA